MYLALKYVHVCVIVWHVCGHLSYTRGPLSSFVYCVILCNMFHRLCIFGPDSSCSFNNNQSDSFAVLMSMIDWSQAFDRQSHKLGIQSFIDNGWCQTISDPYSP